MGNVCGSEDDDELYSKYDQPNQSGSNLSKSIKKMPPPPPLEGETRKWVKKINRYWLVPETLSRKKKEKSEAKLMDEAHQEEVKQYSSSDRTTTKPDEEVKRKKKKRVPETDLITDELQLKWFKPDNQHDQEV